MMLIRHITFRVETSVEKSSLEAALHRARLQVHASEDGEPMTVHGVPFEIRVDPPALQEEK